MKQKLIFVSAFLTLALLVAACSPKAAPATDIPQPEMTEAPMEKMTPAVEVLDQGIVDGRVTVSSVDMAVDGWVVIHTTDAEGKPGPVIGHAAAPAGSSNDITVDIDVEQITPQLFAMLHIDAGTAGTYEFPGEDIPVKDGEAIVMKPFNLNGLNPFVRTSDQAIQNGTVTVDAAYMTQAGWVVIHTTNDEGKPGPVIGNAALPEGFSTSIPVTIDSGNATSKLFAMLHVDAGVAGTYEFPGDDIPVMDEGAIVMAPFNVEEMATSNEVTIANFSFGPNELQVKVGTTVTWTNQDSTRHTVTADDGTFDSGALSEGSSFSFTFTEAGTFPYSCNFHPSMVGTVTVVP
jgi:plastocyanin